MVDAIDEHLGVPLSGLPGLLPPSGHHNGAGHHKTTGPVAATAATATAPTTTATQEV
jgi:hypothetical protein